MNSLSLLREKLPEELTSIDEKLGNYTTLRIGGPADIFFRAQTEKQLVGAIVEATKLKIQMTILGWGSNVLISDKGIRGLVIKNETSEIVIGKETKSVGRKQVDKPRWHGDSKEGTFKYEFADLNYDEDNFPRVEVTLSSGVSLPKAINDLISIGVTGLQWFSRIPGTIGGAVHNNIHGGTRFFSEFVSSVKVVNKEGKIVEIPSQKLGLLYDRSRFHDSGEVILSVTLSLFKGDASRAKEVAFEWAKRKSVQPPRSAGCTFKNISNEDMARLSFPTTSAGYIIEHILKMGGYKVGVAMVSTAHHNFIVNTGGASAKDYLSIVNEIKARTKKELGIDLSPEIFFLGEF